MLPCVCRLERARPVARILNRTRQRDGDAGLPSTPGKPAMELGRSRAMKFTVILTEDPEDGGYVAECPAIRGCVSEGDTVEEALANIEDAISACLETLTQRQLPVPAEGRVIVAQVHAELPEAQAA